MNKKQRNRKLVSQNNRNRIFNRRYTSTIKTLSKLYAKKIKKISFEGKNQETLLNLEETKKISNTIYSIIDKAVKKRVIHKNTAARKKSKVSKMLRHNIKFLEYSLKI